MELVMAETGCGMWEGSHTSGVSVCVSVYVCVSM